MKVTRQGAKRAPRGCRVALATSAAFATVFAAGCGREADEDAISHKNRAQLPYQLAVALPQSEPALPVSTPKAAAVAPRSAAPVALAAASDVPVMPAPMMAPPVTFVLDIPAPPAPAALPVRLEQEEAPPKALAGVSPVFESSHPIAEVAAELSPAIADAEPRVAAVPQDLADRGVYIPQVTQSVRAAYIAQVDAAAPGQRLAVRAGDTVIGKVQFQVTDGVVSVNIGQVLDLFEGHFDSGRFAELRGSQAAQSFVSLDRLQAAGIPLEYNAAYDELTLAPQLG